MSTDTYPYRYNFDAHMIQRANARGKVAVTCGNETRIGILFAWRPRRVAAGRTLAGRRYIARVDFGHGPETVKLATFTVVPA